MMITDCHVHYGKNNWFHIDAGIDNLLRAADRAGIDRMLVTDLTALFYDMVEGNEAFRLAIQGHTDRIIPYFTVCSARHGDWPVKALDRYVNDHGFRALKIYSVPPLFVMTDDYMIPIIEKAAELKIPILAHASPGELIYLAQRVPEAILILAHLSCTPQAHGDWHEAALAARKYPNIYLDTASSSFDNGMMEFAVEQVGAEKILFGSDMPLLNPILQVAKVRETSLTDEQKALILHGNIDRILRLRG